MIDNIELYKALAKARTEFTKVKFDSMNPHFKNKFASLASMHDATVDALSANGLTILQLPTDLDGRFALKTVLAHVSGASIETTLPMPPTKNDPQGIGSAMTYARRYSYAAILNIVGEPDDDGELASREPETITKTEAASLSKLIDSTDTDTAKVLGFYKIKSLDKLPKCQYAKVVKRFEEKANESATA
tara:strand:- start:41 stop:607 length:567 start_codon:yes stop_codon:yes gene_type:complete